MKQRVYFFVPDIDAANRLLGQIHSSGVEDKDIHVICRDDITLEPLPEADVRQESDLYNAARNGAVLGSSIGLLGGLVAMTFPPAGVTLGGAAILGSTAIGTALGTWFSTLVGVSVPNQDLQQFEDKIADGEVMFLLDLTEHQEEQLTATLLREYPDMVLSHGNLEGEHFENA